MHVSSRPSFPVSSVAVVVGPLLLAASCPAVAGTASLQASGGGAWGGTPNTCTYSGFVVDAAGNVTITCQATSSGPTPPVILNAPNQTLTQGAAMANLNLAGYVQTTDGDPITGYSYTGTLPAGVTLSPTTGLVSGTPGAAGTYTINWAASDKDGPGTADAVQFVVAASGGGGGSGACGPMPSNYVELDYPNYSSSSAYYTTTIGPGQGLALRFTINRTAYLNGYKVTDGVGGTKSYKISRCPGGTDGPVDGQNGTTSVNGDGATDDCSTMLTDYVRYRDTSGASPVYYANASNLSWQATCFLPTTTAQGSSTPATYYLNIENTSTTSQTGIQLKNIAQPN